MARPPTNDPKVPLPVNVPASLLDRLRRQAADRNITLTALVNERLDDRTGRSPRRPRPRPPST